MSTATPAATPPVPPVPEANRQRVLDLFLELVRIDSPSGAEDAMAARLLRELPELGFEASRDGTGNVVARRAGRGRIAAESPLLLSAHMDTVQPGRGIVPILDGDVVRTDGSTILGADDKAGIAAILEAVRRADELALDTRPLEAVFSVQEETGLTGAKGLDVGQLAARQALVLDSNGPLGAVVNQAPAQNNITVTVIGKASHAGVAPELGISALVVAAKALAEMRLGRIDEETTANFGVIAGGIATNVVPERVVLQGEARSRDEAKLEAQTAHMTGALQAAAAAAGARVEVEVKRSYAAINVAEQSALVALVKRALRRCGLEPEMHATGGGSDANIYNGLGVEAVNLGLGYQHPHSVDERIGVEDLAQAARVVLAAIT